ncbi:toxin [Scrofimicrobium sp. R131]|uniref:Toxin n=1 Tax=Scrofimicrobium appendicitidis TaxID=3079930 RepID=A0AAU7V7R2_9ACTO
MSEASSPRRRRRVVQINPIDQARLERGLAPTWLEPAQLSDDEPVPEQQGETANDRRLQEDRPPHWSPRP